MTACAFPFDHPATLAVWLISAITVGWLYGGHVAGQVGTDPQKYRERWGYRPRTSAVAIGISLLVALVPLIAQFVFGVTFCNDFFYGWMWLLIAPWVATALARALVPMVRLARTDAGLAKPGPRRTRREDSNH